jgi:hypothetical protein
MTPVSSGKSTAPRARRKGLRAVFSDIPRKHPVVMDSEGGICILGEIITFAEWERIPARARPRDVVFVPGIGFLIGVVAPNGFHGEGPDQYDWESAHEQVKEAYADYLYDRE